jgi:mono/diheme cytochrome c family protein
VAVVLLAIAALLFWQPAAVDAQAPAQNPLAGAQVFGSKGCVSCHSVHGLGGKVGPDLGRISRRRSFYELAATMWNHLPQMGEQARERGIERPPMNSGEAANLIAFLFTIDYFDPPGNVEVGQQLFTEKKCVVCHQVGSYGGVVGPELDFLGQYGSPILVASAMWNHGPAMAEEMRERGLQRPGFTASELTDLIAYLESMAADPLEGSLYVLPGRADDGRVIFVEKRCNQCHGVSGPGIRVGGNLAERRLQPSLMEFAAAMWNKAPAMMRAMDDMGLSVPQLGAGEMADVVAFLYSVQYFSEAGYSGRGRQRIREKGCLNCHSLDGRGGESAGDLALVRGIASPASVISSLWNHSIVMEAGMESEAVPWPIFSPQEMADVAAFFQSLESSR